MLRAGRDTQSKSYCGTCMISCISVCVCVCVCMSGYVCVHAIVNLRRTQCRIYNHDVRTFCELFFKVFGLEEPPAKKMLLASTDGESEFTQEACMWNVPPKSRCSRCICTEYKTYFSSLKNYCGIKQYVLKIMCYKTIVVPSKNNTVNIHLFRYLPPVQVLVLKLN